MGKFLNYLIEMNSQDFGQHISFNSGDKVSVNGVEGEISTFSDGEVFKVFPPVKIKRYMFKDNEGNSKAVSVHQIKLISRSKNIIKWEEPDFYSEIEEYFDNEQTEKFLKDRGLDFDTEDELLDLLNGGKLVNITKEELSGCENFEFDKFSESMEKILLKNGSIKLSAPIIFKFNNLYYKRMNLAFKYNIPLKVWLIKI
jgi:hypothetical protein